MLRAGGGGPFLPPAFLFFGLLRGRSLAAGSTGGKLAKLDRRISWRTRELDSKSENLTLAAAPRAQPALDVFCIPFVGRSIELLPTQLE